MSENHYDEGESAPPTYRLPVLAFFVSRQKRNIQGSDQFFIFTLTGRLKRGFSEKPLPVEPIIRIPEMANLNQSYF